MSTKQVLVYIFQNKEDIKIEVNCVKVLGSLFKRNADPEYEIEHKFTNQGRFLESSTLDDMARIGTSIKTALTAYDYDSSPMRLFLDIDFIFNGSLALPKIAPNKLMASFKATMEIKYGKIINDYYYQYQTKVNASKGYDFDLLFIDRLKYQKVLGIFSTQKLRIGEIYFLPSIYINIFRSKEMIDKTQGAFLVHEGVSTFCLYDNKQVVYSRNVDIGYRTPERTLANKYSWSTEQAIELINDSPDRADVTETIVKSMKKIIDISYIALANHPEAVNVDTVYLGCNVDYLPKIIAPFKHLFKDDLKILFENQAHIQKSLLVYLSLMSKKDFFTLPQRVK